MMVKLLSLCIIFCWLLSARSEESNGSCIDNNAEACKNVGGIKSVAGYGNCPNLKSSQVLLSRKKRSLSWPDGSSFVITLSLVKALLLGVPLGWNIALEVDIPFKTPGYLELLRYKYPRLGLHHRQRRDLWGRFEGVLDVNGFEGKTCILRTICEASRYLAPKDVFLVHDLLRIIFSAPEVGGPSDLYTAASKAEDCTRYHTCPFSMLKMLLSYSKLYYQ